MEITANSCSGGEAVALRQDQPDLISRAQEGDPTAFRTLVDKYSRRVYGMAHQIVGNSEDARDIAQEVFIILHRSLGKFDSHYRFETWLYRVTVNRAIDFHRRTRDHRHQRLSESNDSPLLSNNPADAAVENRELRRLLSRLVGRLTIKQRKVLVLRDLQGFTVAEIADILQCRKSTVRVHLARARGRMKEYLSQTDLKPSGGDSK